ncbi:MAG: septum formation family protein [Marmoricola sp.]
MTRATRSLALLGAGLLTVAVLTGCSDSGAPATTGRPTPSVAPAPPPAPAVRTCHDLDVAAALRPSDATAPVPCTGRHTSVTIAVGQVDPVVDGHLLAIDSAPVQQQVADGCRARVDAYVGGSTETQRLSLVQAVWFSPSLTQADQGALWYRCDLVVSSGGTTFRPLPARTRNLLAGKQALDRYGTCGTAAPGTPAFTRVLCAAPHTWRARATIPLPAHARYLARPVGKAADSRCRDIEARRAANALKLRWSFEWPTRAQWDAGQRYGLCWTPR